MGDPGLQADERVLVRAMAADPASDWRHGFSSGHLYLTDRRLLLQPWSPSAMGDRTTWELSVDAIDRVSSAPVPIWLFGVVRLWLPGIRVVTSDGRGKTIVMGRDSAREFLAALDDIVKARRRLPARSGAPSAR